MSVFGELVPFPPFFYSLPLAPLPPLPPLAPTPPLLLPPWFHPSSPCSSSNPLPMDMLPSTFSHQSTWDL